MAAKYPKYPAYPANNVVQRPHLSGYSGIRYVAAPGDVTQFARRGKRHGTVIYKGGSARPASARVMACNGAMTCVKKVRRCHRALKRLCLIAVYLSNLFRFWSLKKGPCVHEDGGNGAMAANVAAGILHQ